MNQFWTSIFGTDLPTVEYCEAASSGIIARPGYFISNFAYIAVGIYLLTRKGVYSKIFGAISISIGIASGIYDASFLFGAQILDLMTMFLLINFLLIINIKKLAKLNNAQSIVLFCIFQLIYFFSILNLQGSSGRLIYGVFVVGVIISEYLMYRLKLTENFRNFRIALATFVLAFVLWNFDSTRLFCSPIELLNGRAIFHYITAITIYYLHLHTKQK